MTLFYKLKKCCNKKNNYHMSNPEVIVVIKGEELENTKDKNDDITRRDNMAHIFVRTLFPQRAQPVSRLVTPYATPV